MNTKKNSLDIIIPAKNPGGKLKHNIRKWLNQEVPNHWLLNIYLVDDGSTDHSFTDLLDLYGNNPAIHIVRHSTNQGRSTACNTGAEAGCGNYLLFFDADCEPYSDHLIHYYTQSIENFQAEVAFGNIISKHDDFWGRYFNEVNTRRVKDFLNGNSHALTTANFLIKRELFLKVGKFNTEYKHYGFEDKDLLIRVAKHSNRIHFNDKATIYHNDLLTLKNIQAKMFIAGKYSSCIFQKQHPEHYRQMVFSKVDARQHLFLRLLTKIIRLAYPLVSSTGEYLINRELPYWIKKNTVKTCSAFAFLIGSNS